MQYLDDALMKSVIPARKPYLLAELDGYYSKEVLTKGWLYYALMFYAENSHKSWGDISAAEILRLQATKKINTKSDVVAAAFSVIMNESVFTDFKDWLPKKVADCIEATLWERSVSRRTMELIAGDTIFEKPRNEWSVPDIKREFAFFNSRILQGFGFKLIIEDLKVDLSLPPTLKKILQNYYIQPKEFTLNPIAKPNDEDLSYFNAEDTIATTLPALLSYYYQDQLKYTANGKPNAAGMKKMLRSLQIREFFSSDQFPTLRCILMSGLLYGLRKGNVIAAPHEEIKNLFQKHITLFTFAGYLFNSLKGISNIPIRDFESKAVTDVMSIYKQLPKNEWVSKQNITDYAKIHDKKIVPFSDYDLANKIHYETTVYNLYSEPKKYITLGDQNDFIVKPAIAGFAFLLAAFGGLELAYYDIPQEGEFGENWFSEYDTLVAVRLTNLGAYVLGKTNDYVPAETDSDCKLVLDPNSLTIRVEGNTSLAHVRLGNYTSKVSETRYQFSHGQFLKECKNLIDVTNKINMFKHSVGQPLPENWDEALNKIISNTKLIKRVTSQEVFVLPTDNRELHRLIAQDEVLKKIVIKAEQYHILVEGDHIPTFKNRLKEFGILLSYP